MLQLILGLKINFRRLRISTKHTISSSSIYVFESEHGSNYGFIVWGVVEFER